jgi:hypothetical protein
LQQRACTRAVVMLTRSRTQRRLSCCGVAQSDKDREKKGEDMSTSVIPHANSLIGHIKCVARPPSPTTTALTHHHRPRPPPPPSPTTTQRHRASRTVLVDKHHQHCLRSSTCSAQRQASIDPPRHEHLIFPHAQVSCLPPYPSLWSHATHPTLTTTADIICRCAQGRSDQNSDPARRCIRVHRSRWR